MRVTGLTVFWWVLNEIIHVKCLSVWHILVIFTIIFKCRNLFILQASGQLLIFYETCSDFFNQGYWFLFINLNLCNSRLTFFLFPWKGTICWATRCVRYWAQYLMCILYLALKSRYYYFADEETALTKDELLFQILKADVIKLICLIFTSRWNALHQSYSTFYPCTSYGENVHKYQVLLIWNKCMVGIPQSSMKEEELAFILHCIISDALSH